jgi:hypothetical protein
MDDTKIIAPSPSRKYDPRGFTFTPSKEAVTRDGVLATLLKCLEFYVLDTVTITIQKGKCVVPGDCLSGIVDSIRDVYVFLVEEIVVLEAPLEHDGGAINIDNLVSIMVRGKPVRAHSPVPELIDALDVFYTDKVRLPADSSQACSDVLSLFRTTAQEYANILRRTQVHDTDYSIAVIKKLYSALSLARDSIILPHAKSSRTEDAPPTTQPNSAF